MTTEDPKAFQIVKYVPRIVYDKVTLLDTDDWVEFEKYQLDHPRFGSSRGGVPLWEARGWHPTHKFIDGRCTACGAWQNGSFGSHAPCGYHFGDEPFPHHIQRLAAEKPAGGVS